MVTFSRKAFRSGVLVLHALEMVLLSEHYCSVVASG